MKKRLIAWMAQIQKFMDRPWYIPLIAVMGAIDMFILVVPTDGFMLTAVMARPRRWIAAALIVGLGSSVGAGFFAEAIHLYGETVVELILGPGPRSETWISVMGWVSEYGVWAVGLVAFGPFPIHPGIAMGALSGMSSVSVFMSVLVGRVIKNIIMCYIASHTPHLVGSLFGVRKEVKEVQQVSQD